MSFQRLTLRSITAAVLALFTFSCADSPTGPRGAAPVGAIALSDTIFTRSAVIRARVDVPAGYALRNGSVSWTVVSGTATVTEIAGSRDSVDVNLTTAGGVTLRASYTLTSAGRGSTLGIAGPSTRIAGDVRIETERSIAVAAPSLRYGIEPNPSIVAGTSLGGVRVDVVDAAGRLMTNATDSITVTLDPASGTAGATLFGTAAGRAIGGQATFAGLSLQRAGTGYRLIATSPTITVRDTAVTAVVAAAASAAQSTIAVSETLRSIGQTATVTVTLRDQFGNPVLTATPATFVPSATLGTLGTFTCVNGVCTATYTATTVGNATVGATIGGTQLSNGPRALEVVAGPAARFVITGLNVQDAGSSQSITITAYDGNRAASVNTNRLDDSFVTFVLV
jgi:hypothetical protein